MPVRGGVALLVLVTACGVDLPLRDDVIYTCNSTADCPLELSCAQGVRQCVAELDTTPPRLTSIAAASRETVVLVFDEPLNAGVASLGSSYTIVRDDGQALLIEGAAPLTDGKSIILRTSLQRGAAVYTLSTTVGDAQGNTAVLDQSTFTGFGPAPDTTTPEAVAPTLSSIIVVPQAERQAPRITVAWTPRSGVIEYVLQVSTIADFSRIDEEHVIAGSDASFSLPVAEGLTYFWRVRSDASPGFSTSSFTVLFDTVYVYCAPETAVCRSGRGIGSKNVPLEAISRAVTLAGDRGLDLVAIAGRGATAGGQLATYHEPVAVAGGLTLRGGYEPTFTAASDADLHRTRVVYEGSVFTATENTAPIVLENLEAEAVLDPTIPAITQDLAAATFENPRAEVSFRHCLMTTTAIDEAAPGASPPNTTAGVVVVSSTFSETPVSFDATTQVIAGSAQLQSFGIIAALSKVVIDGARVSSGRTYLQEPRASSGALQALFAAVDVRGATLRGRGTTQGTVQCFTSSGSIVDSTVHTEGLSSETCIGVLMDSGAGQRFEFLRNTVAIGSSCPNAAGLVVRSQGDAVVANNLVLANGSVFAYGITVANASTARVINNTVVLGGGFSGSVGVRIQAAFPDLVNNLFVFEPASASVGIDESALDADPKTVVANVFIDCDTGYFDEAAVAYANPDAIANQAIDCSGCGTSRASNNLMLTGIAPFVSVAGPDGDIESTDDNDWRLGTADGRLTAGGIDTSGATCGSNETPRSCGTITTDRAGQPRTLLPSVGAYERD